MGKKRDADVIEIDSEEDPDDKYFVEVITRARVIEDNKFEYRVKWANYSSDDNTWEPYENVQNCTRLLKSFWKEVGKDKRKHPGPVGEEYPASDKWIEEETKIFHRDMGKDNDAGNDDEDEKPRKKEEKKKRPEVDQRKEEKDTKHDIQPEEHKLKEPGPSTSIAPPRFQSEASRKKSVQIVESDSEDDMPLRKRTKLIKSKTKPAVPGRKTSVSVASSVGANDDGDQENENPLSAVRGKYSGMKIRKIPRKETKIHVEDRDGFILSSPPPLTPDEISLHRPKQMAPTYREEVNLNDSDVYGRLFLPSQSQQDPVDENPPLDMDGAENFLETVSSRSAAAALKPSELAKTETPKAVAPPPRPVFKKWNWDGELFVKTDGDFADRLCNIRFEEATDVTETGFKFDLLMEGKDSIRFDRLYSIFEIRTILRGLRRVDQFASMCHAGPADRDTLLIFKRFMRDKMLAARFPVVTDFGHVAEMIVFPVESELSGLLQVPLSLTNHAMCIVALMPWIVPPSTYIPSEVLPLGETKRRSKEQIDEWTKTLEPSRVSSRLVADIQTLDFPEWLVKMVRKQSYCVWARSVEPAPKDYGRTFSRDLLPETAALFDVLTALDATNVGYKRDLHFVFVHVGALETLNTLEALVERRCKRPEIRFFTYGRHACVKPNLWGIHEIYPLGGVVTFTHAALLEDPFGAADLIIKLHKHPLWVSYILPAVLAVFVKFSSLPNNPMEMIKSEPFRFGRILDLIDDGSVSLLQSPSLDEQPKTVEGPSPADDWIKAQLHSLVKSPADVVEDSWRIYIAQFSNKTASEIPTALETEIVADLARMQMQPIIRKSHRRFVVIKGESEKHIPWDKDGFEWLTLKTFNFRDDFHGKAPPPRTV